MIGLLAWKVDIFVLLNVIIVQLYPHELFQRGAYNGTDMEVDISFPVLPYEEILPVCIYLSAVAGTFHGSRSTSTSSFIFLLFYMNNFTLIL